jgi:hypothetical protein
MIIERIQYCDKDGHVSRLDGPAAIEYSGGKKDSFFTAWYYSGLYIRRQDNDYAEMMPAKFVQYLHYHMYNHVPQGEVVKVFTDIIKKIYKGGYLSKKDAVKYIREYKIADETNDLPNPRWVGQDLGIMDDEMY